jgi:hypothetical protein
MALGGLVEQTELQRSIFNCPLLAWRNDANYVAGRYPINFITGPDLVLFGDHLRHGDLVLGCDLSHTRLYSNALILTISRMQSLPAGAHPDADRGRDACNCLLRLSHVQNLIRFHISQNLPLAARPANLNFVDVRHGS